MTTTVRKMLFLWLTCEMPCFRQLQAIRATLSIGTSSYQNFTDYRQLTEPSASRTATVMTTISASSAIRTIGVTPNPSLDEMTGKRKRPRQLPVKHRTPERVVARALTDDSSRFCDSNNSSAPVKSDSDQDSRNHREAHQQAGNHIATKFR